MNSRPSLTRRRAAPSPRRRQADRAVQGVNVANDRINSLDDYTPEQSIKINFKLRSAVLTPESKTSLDQVAEYAKNAKGFLIEVTGYAYESKDKNVNRQLSQQRAESVVRYLVENHNIPLRRILTPFGYGATNPSPTTRRARAAQRTAAPKCASSSTRVSRRARRRHQDFRRDSALKLRRRQKPDRQGGRQSYIKEGG
jgi:outer membrane protein OmpA-like peptidoglycan-associated protein